MEAFGSYNRQRHFNALEGNWNLAEAKLEAFGSYNRQRCFNALEGNWNLAEAKWKLLGVTIGKGALMLWKVTGTLQRPNGSFWESQ